MTIHTSGPCGPASETKEERKMRLLKPQSKDYSTFMAIMFGITIVVMVTFMSIGFVTILGSLANI